ncbi:hypothetical protein Q8F55_007166 [Vanrija albida]|uniref:Uncharacterized protein n=1 Tax=Vanrija albida TaxID=181172 RepID=A0ABR3Q032_9TREE
MRLIQANKILLASCVVVVPVSIYAGVALKERYLAKELATVPDESQIVKERAVRARIAQLEHERKELIQEGNDLDIKIADLKKRMGRV